MSQCPYEMRGNKMEVKEKAFKMDCLDSRCLDTQIKRKSR